MTVAELITIVNNNMPNNMNELSIVNFVNILEDSIYSKFIKDKEKPELKEIQNIGTDKLALCEYGQRWELMYEYFIYGQICLLNEEYGKANNYFMLYNSLVDEFVQFYFPIMTNEVREKRLKNFR